MIISKYNICLQTTLRPAGPAISRAEPSKADVKVQTYQLPRARLLLFFMCQVVSFTMCQVCFTMCQFLPMCQKDENIVDWFAFSVVLEEDENISRIIWPFFFSSAVCHKPGFAPASLGPVRRKIHNLCTWLYFGYCPVVNPLEIARNSISLFSVTKSTSLNNYTRGIFAKPGALKGAEFHVYFLYLNKH